MAFVLCIAGLDPSGGAGLSADMRALEFLGVGCFPVASALTVQNSGSFAALEPVSAGIIGRQIDAALGEAAPGAVKVGLLGSVENIELLARKLPDIPLVVDPVIRTSTGFNVVNDEMLAAYEELLFPRATLVMPNAYETSVLTGQKVTDVETAKKACPVIADMGPKVVLVKGGHFESERGSDVLYVDGDFHVLAGTELRGDVRGTGCTFSALIAGYLALDFGIVEAVKRAKLDMARALEFSVHKEPKHIAFSEHLSEGQRNVWLAVQKAASEIGSILPPEMVAEVGNNIAYALEGAESPEDVCSLDSRLVLKGSRIVTMGLPVFGRKSHIGRVVMAAVKHDPNLRCALNLRYSEKTLDIAGDVGFKVATFDREHEPDQASSVEWGTARALQDFGSADIVYDLGAKGKEPMIRLLATNPEEAVNKLRKIVEKPR